MCLLLLFHLLFYWLSSNLESKQLEARDFNCHISRAWNRDSHIASTQYISLNKLFLSISFPPKINSMKESHKVPILGSCKCWQRPKLQMPFLPVRVTPPALLCTAGLGGSVWTIWHLSHYTFCLWYEFCSWEWKPILKEQFVISFCD